jgi:hypothetical protein
MPPTVGGHEVRSILIKKRVVKVFLRVCGLLVIAGILAVNAVAGSGPDPDHNGPCLVVVVQ